MSETIELSNDPKEHADDVVLRASERLSNLTPESLAQTIDKRISEAEDRGLAGAVFWHGKWWNYSQAITIRDYLRTLVPRLATAHTRKSSHDSRS